MSRHHILPPIIDTPAPPKPKETKRRRGVGPAGDKGDVDGTEEVGDVEETSETRAFAATRATPPPLPDTSTSIEAAEKGGNHYAGDDETSAHCMSYKTYGRRFGRPPAPHGRECQVSRALDGRRAGSCQTGRAIPRDQLD